MNNKNRQKKENKVKGILILATLVLIFLFALISILSPKNKINKLALIEKNLDTPSGSINIGPAITEDANPPRLGAGMIPIKYNATSNVWIITTENDPEWYDYRETGTWANVMLSDGVYQAEMLTNMNGKKFATPNIEISATDVQTLGTIFTWIPRLAYSENELIFLNGTSVVDYYYTTNDCFNEELYGAEKIDIGYEGIWVGKKEYTSQNSVDSLNLEMGKENNKQGLIKNEVLSTTTENEKEVINKLLNKYKDKNYTMIQDTQTNSYRQVIKILNVNRRLPITMTHSYEGKTAVLDNLYHENTILYYLDGYGQKLVNNRFTPDEELSMTFYGVDNMGNIRKHKVNFNNIRPDLTGFNPNTTFYVQYDEFGNEDSSIPIGEDMPGGWSDYYNQLWANLVVRNNGDELYYVWIPRYQYKLDSENQKVIAEFIQETVTEPTEGYQIPEAFTWTDADGNEVQLKGYWISKYRLSATSTYSPNISGGQNIITIKDVVSTFGDEYKYYAYLIKDGKIVRGPIEFAGDYVFDGVASGDYSVNIIVKTAEGKHVQGITKQVIVINKSSLGLPNGEGLKPDVSGFNKDKTFYVTYDANGNETSVIPLGEDIPSNWYDYDKQQWANVVVRENGLENYYVWIPRYQYRLDDPYQDSYVEFIGTDKVTPDEGYQIPDAFVWESNSGEKIQLPGYWMSKYELRDDVIKRLNASVVVNSSTIKVSNIDSKVNATSFEITLIQGGRRVWETVPMTDTYIFERLDAGTYTVHLIAKDENGNQLAGYTREVTLAEPEAPDLTGFNPDTTFYVTYDVNGNETSIVPINEAEPENWYDYRDQQWANLVVRNNGDELYYVWIPRYQYLLDSSNQIVYTEYIPKTKTEADLGYQIPEAFTWTDADGNTVQLGGYWMSKYRLSATSTYRPDIEGGNNIIEIKDLVQTIGSDNYTYEAYLIENGQRIRGPITITGDYTFEDVPVGEYSVFVEVKEKATGKHSQGIVKQVVVTTHTTPNAPDMSGFNKDKTFYVTYDANGNETSIIPIGEDAPNGWYDYDEQRWANVVVREDGLENYYVWVPRYQYRLVDAYQDSYVQFIPTSKIVADNGYTIPDAFTWTSNDGETIQLAGYWMSKYELRDDVIKRLHANVIADTSTIKVSSIDSKVNATTFEISLIKNGRRLQNDTLTSDTYIFTGLTEKSYVVHLIAKDENGNQLAGYTKEVKLVEPEAPDLTGFNPDTTFYVTYDANGNETSIVPINEAEPNDWYNYRDQLWANIVVRNDGDELYYVWIPRYQYLLDSPNQKVYTEYIPVTQTTPDTGYQIPEAFTWTDADENTVPLKGYWMSKYRLSSASAYRPDIAGAQNKIEVKNVVSTIGTEYKYEAYLIQYGQRIRGPITITGDYTFEDVPVGDYSVFIEVKDKTTNKHVQGIVKQVTVIKETIANVPDLSSFNPNTTFYVTYDANGNETSTKPIGETAPEDWYNYSSQKWANIVVRESGYENYFVWIPRYQYKLVDAYQDSYVKFISTDVTEPEEGYTIPDAFTWMSNDGETIQLPGYWMSKYELRDDVIKRLSADVTVDNNSIRISTIVSTTENVTYEVSLIKDGVRQDTKAITNGEVTFTGLTTGKYSIHLISKDSNNHQVAGFVKEVTLTEPELPDFTGFNVDKTFIITGFGEGGVATSTQSLRSMLKSGANISSDNTLVSGEINSTSWYDYQNQRWANIVTRNGNDELYFVWIPRYQYLLDSSNQKINIQFIPTTKTTPDTGYQIPEAFTWTDADGNTVQLRGYWMSKYRLSATENDNQ